MTDILTAARQRVLSSKLWGITCERPITTGQWDNGSLVQEQVKEVLRQREEAEGE